MLPYAQTQQPLTCAGVLLLQPAATNETHTHLVLGEKHKNHTYVQVRWLV